MNRGRVPALLAMVAAAGCAPSGARPKPPDFGPGFTEVGAGLRAAPPCTPVPFDQVQFGEPTATTAFFADLDGDGAKEVVASCAGDNARPAPTSRAYRYDATTGTLAPAPGLLPAGAPALLGALDLDGDGHLDLLSGRLGLSVAWGLPGGGFGAFVPLASALMGGQGLFLADLDGDGWLDALTGDTSCQAGHADLQVILRTGLRTFALRRDLVPGSDAPANPYGVLAVDGPPGRPDALFAVGGSCFPGGATDFHRVVSLTGDGFPRYGAFDPLPPDAAFRKESGRADEPIANRVPMAAATGDLDGDGHPDLVVTIDAALEILLGGDRWPYRDVSEATGVRTVEAASGLDEIPWGVALVDVDADGRPDLVVAEGNDEGAWRDPHRQIGPQTLVVNWNAGGLRFADVSHALNVDQPGQWRALFVGDLDGDGNPDIAAGGMGRLPAIYRNDIDRGDHGFALRLVGTSSNRLALGASVEVFAAGTSAPRRYSVPRVSDMDLVEAPEIFVGLGHAERADRVRITWPSGVVQVVHDLAAGTDHRIVEPALFELNPATRHLPADGHSELVVTVHPRREDGTVRPGATVSVRGVGGAPVTITATDVLADGSVAVHVQAPSTPGSSRLEISVDGIVSPVHPRVWWE